MKKKSQLSRVLMMLITSVIVLSCNSGSKSTENTVDKEEQTEANVETTPDFQISLAQWSLHKTYFEGELDPKDFPDIAAGYGINSIELVNTFYFSKSIDNTYWNEFKQKCDDVGVTVGLIMCDALGNLGDADPEARMVAVDKHYLWVDVAKILGAHSIRVNAAGQGTPEEVASNAVDGISKLAEYAASKNINIIVENHGGYSSDGKWLTGVIAKVGMDNVGTLPDFGNFCIERGSDGCVNEYDRYQGMTELMPYAKGVSAKSNDFDENGNETNSDFLRIMKIVKESGFKGYIGIEYEGNQLSEDEGIKATKALLEKVFKEL
jgi:sugar phosphate isomerase/epimerase